MANAISKHKLIFMRYFILLPLLLSTISLSAQIDRGLVAYYSFDDCTATDDSGVTGDGTIIGNPTCECGVLGNSLLLDGFDDEILLLGTINNQFERQDFTVSMYIKSTSAQGRQSILSKREMCGPDNAFGIRIEPQSNKLLGDVSENSSKQANVSGSLDFNACWQHVVLVRSGTKTSLYINGVLRNSADAVSRIDLQNNTVLSIAGGACVSGSVDNPFAGFIDEVRIYDRTLNQRDIDELFVAPDNIVTPDQTIFLGNSVQIETNVTCATDFDWSPTDNVSDPDIAEPEITPITSNVYKLLFNDGVCFSEDSIRITVIDPNDLDCGQVFLPKAFTPNGDALNDLYGISNPYAIEELISFEIFDRWGGRGFFTDNPFQGWDGNFKGEPINPGVLLYRVRVRCDGEEDTSVGSLSIIR